MEEANFIDLCEADEWKAALGAAVAHVREAMKDPQSVPVRSWVTSKKQAKRWLASDTPFEDFPEEAEYWVAYYYDQQMGIASYLWRFGRNPGYPDTRTLWGAGQKAKEGNLDRPTTPPRPY